MLELKLSRFSTPMLHLKLNIVDTQSRSITVFSPASLPVTYRNDLVITDKLLPELEITANAVFQRAGLSG
jgi:hypothetical protein